MKRIWFFVLILSLIPLFFWYSLAESDDCRLVQTGNIKDFSEDYVSYLNSFDTLPDHLKDWVTTTGLKEALTDLKAYCCKNGSYKNNEDAQASCKEDRQYVDNRNDYLQDGHLFYQLQNVMVTKLSTTWDKADKLANEWNTFIEGIALDTNGTVPSKITSEFLKYREYQPQYNIPYYNGTILKGLSWYINIISWYYESLNETENWWNLNTRYNNLCQSIVVVLATLPIGANSSDLFQQQNACRDFVDRKITKNTRIIKNLSIYKSNNLLTDNLTSYSETYWSNRIKIFEANMQEMLDHLMWVIRIFWPLKNLVS